MKRAAFLDRDGVINEDLGYVHKIKDFRFATCIFELCRNLANAGYLIIVITNQAGIGKKMYSVEDFLDLNLWMVSRFLTENIPIAKVYYCPHDPLSTRCKCRKPSPYYVYEAQREFDLKLDDCMIIGDKETDVLACQSWASFERSADDLSAPDFLLSERYLIVNKNTWTHGFSVETTNALRLFDSVSDLNRALFPRGEGCSR